MDTTTLSTTENNATMGAIVEIVAGFDENARHNGHNGCLPLQTGNNAGAAFEHRGSQAAVWAPRYGQAHQQYFSPRWAAEAFAAIADRLFDVGRTRASKGAEWVDTGPSPRLNVLDPTCGSGRLLAPFAQRGHYTLGIELDERLTPVARRAVGKESIRHGDVCAYGAVLPQDTFSVAVINPPYGLWWPVEGSYLARYELAAAQSIESQNMALELVTGTLRHHDGLLMALLSGRFFETYPKALEYVRRHYQVVAHLTLPRPYKPEYGIDVDGLLLVAYRVYSYSDKYPAPLTGEWEGGADTEALVEAVAEAFAEVRRQQYSRYSSYAYQSGHLSAGYHGRLPQVPELDMTVQVDTSAPVVRLTRKGLRLRTVPVRGSGQGLRPGSGQGLQRDGSDTSPHGDWSAAWLKFYRDIPLAAYSAAEGAATDVANAYGSLPNVLIAGAETTRQRLADLGFEVEVTPHDQAQIAVAARRYARLRLPVRELEPMEYLAWFNDGPITARATVVVPYAGPEGEDVQVVEGQTYDLRARWERVDQVVESKAVEGKGKSKSYIEHTHLDRGYMVFRFADDGGRTFTVREVDAGQVKALIDAFGLPEVPTVDDLPDFSRWAAEVDRAVERQAALNGGLRPYPSQRLDITRFCTKPCVANLWEMGAGKTMAMGFWAAVRGYERTLFVTPPSVVNDLLRDLNKWGFGYRELTHAGVSRLKAQKRARSAFFRRVREARQRVRNAEAREEMPDEGDVTLVQREERRQKLLQEQARARRHLRNLRDIQAKACPGGQAGGKATGLPAQAGDIAAEIAETQAEIAALEERLASFPAPPERPKARFVTGYTDISLGDHMGIYDEWPCEHFDQEGNLVDIAVNTSARCAECGKTRKSVVTACPKCGASGNDWRGEGDGGARMCRQCGYRAWTLGASQYHDTEGPALSPVPGRCGAKGKRITSPHGFPLVRRVKKLFSCVLLDEAQDVKGKLSLRGAASRGLRANGRAILTGTWMKGYITDLFWSAGWLMGFGSPLWPFPYNGGPARFLAQFGTFQYVTKEFADSLQVGRRKLIPSVSNLNRLWKLTGAVAIRREKKDFLRDLPPKHVEMHWVRPTGLHARLTGEVGGAMKDVLAAELRKPQEKVNMGRIGMALWWGRYVASCPTLEGCAHYAGAYGHSLNVDKASTAEIEAIQDLMRLQGKVLQGEAALAFNKARQALDIIKAARAAGDKVLLFTSLTGLYQVMAQALDRERIPWLGMQGVATDKRRARVDEFESGEAVVLLAGTGQLNRGVTITGANHVILLNTEWSPEVTLQAEDRVHRPGQRKEVHVHYILSSDTVDEDMWELIVQKWAAQRAVQDREAQFESVEAILAAAVTANAQLAVARSVVERTAHAQGKTQAEIEAEMAEMEHRLVFGQAVAPRRAGRVARRPVAVQQLSLFG
ncbi:MAG: helicase-related protein [Chloroflexota bacterium]